MPWYIPWSDTLILKAYRYILNRYIGFYISEKLLIDQLDINLNLGKSTVKNLHLNSQNINNVLKDYMCAELLEGHIDFIDFAIPWSTILSEPSKIEIHNLNLLFKIKNNNGFNSISKSQMTDSLSMIREYLESDLNSKELLATNFEGLELFAKTLESIMTKICFNIKTLNIYILLPFKGMQILKITTSNIIVQDLDSFVSETICSELMKKNIKISNFSLLTCLNQKDLFYNSITSLNDIQDIKLIPCILIKDINFILHKVESTNEFEFTLRVSPVTILVHPYLTFDMHELFKLIKRIANLRRISKYQEQADAGNEAFSSITLSPGKNLDQLYLPKPPEIKAINIKPPGDRSKNLSSPAVYQLSKIEIDIHSILIFLPYGYPKEPQPYEKLLISDLLDRYFSLDNHSSSENDFNVFGELLFDRCDYIELIVRNLNFVYTRRPLTLSVDIAPDMLQQMPDSHLKITSRSLTCHEVFHCNTENCSKHLIFQVLPNHSQDNERPYGVSFELKKFCQTDFEENFRQDYLFHKTHLANSVCQVCHGLHGSRSKSLFNVGVQNVFCDFDITLYERLQPLIYLYETNKTRQNQFYNNIFPNVQNSCATRCLNFELNFKIQVLKIHIRFPTSNNRQCKETTFSTFDNYKWWKRRLKSEYLAIVVERPFVHVATPFKSNCPDFEYELGVDDHSTVDETYSFSGPDLIEMCFRRLVTSFENDTGDKDNSKAPLSNKCNKTTAQLDKFSIPFLCIEPIMDKDKQVIFPSIRISRNRQNNKASLKCTNDGHTNSSSECMYHSALSSSSQLKSSQFHPILTQPNITNYINPIDDEHFYQPLLHKINEDPSFESSLHSKTFYSNQNEKIFRSPSERTNSVTCVTPRQGKTNERTEDGGIQPKPSPFTKRKVLYENAQMILPGSKDEMHDFIKHHSESSTCLFVLSIYLPSFDCILPSKALFDVLYQRIYNDLILWIPSSPYHDLNQKFIFNLNLNLNNNNNNTHNKFLSPTESSLLTPNITTANRCEGIPFEYLLYDSNASNGGNGNVSGDSDLCAKSCSDTLKSNGDDNQRSYTPFASSVKGSNISNLQFNVPFAVNNNNKFDCSSMSQSNLTNLSSRHPQKLIDNSRKRGNDPQGDGRTFCILFQIEKAHVLLNAFDKYLDHLLSQFNTPSLSSTTSATTCLIDLSLEEDITAPLNYKFLLEMDDAFIYTTHSLDDKHSNPRDVISRATHFQLNFSEIPETTLTPVAKNPANKLTPSTTLFSSFRSKLDSRVPKSKIDMTLIDIIDHVPHFTLFNSKSSKKNLKQKFTSPDVTLEKNKEYDGLHHYEFSNPSSPAKTTTRASPRNIRRHFSENTQTSPFSIFGMSPSPKVSSGTRIPINKNTNYFLNYDQLSLSDDEEVFPKKPMFAPTDPLSELKSFAKTFSRCHFTDLMPSPSSSTSNELNSPYNCKLNDILSQRLDTKTNEQMLSLALKSRFNRASGIKESILSVALRDLAMEHEVADSCKHWFDYVYHFFHIPQDSNVVKVVPIHRLNQIHLQFDDCAITYNPINLPYHVYFNVGSLNFSNTSLVLPKLTELKLIIEETSLYLAQSEGNDRKNDLDLKDYCRVASVGLFEIGIRKKHNSSNGHDQSQDDLDAENKTESSPQFEFKALNDTLVISTCYDSFIALLKLITYYANDGDLAFQNREQPNTPASMDNTADKFNFDGLPTTSQTHHLSNARVNFDSESSSPIMAPMKVHYFEEPAMKNISELLTEASEDYNYALNCKKHFTKDHERGGSDIGSATDISDLLADAMMEHVGMTDPSKPGGHDIKTHFKKSKEQQHTHTLSSNKKRKDVKQSFINNPSNQTSFSHQKNVNNQNKGYHRITASSSSSPYSNNNANNRSLIYADLKTNPSSYSRIGNNFEVIDEALSESFNEQIVIKPEKKIVSHLQELRPSLEKKTPLPQHSLLLENYFGPPKFSKFDHLQTPSNFPCPRERYYLGDFSIRWELYGGNDFDFDTTNSASDLPNEFQQVDMNIEHNVVNFKTQSTVSSLSPLSKRKVVSVKKLQKRVKNISMEIHLNKIRYLHETFSPEETQVCRQVLTIQECQILDKLSTSRYNKFLYLYVSDQYPRKTNSPMILIKALRTKPEIELPEQEECSLRISIQPLRLNMDQEALIFLREFFHKITKGCAASDLGKTASNQEDAISLPSRTPSYSEIPISGDYPASSLHHHNTPTATSEEDVSEENSETLSRDGRQSGNKHSTQPSATFFRPFTFAPEVPIKIDYKGRFIDLEQGTLTGLLMALAQLNCSEIKLKKIQLTSGILGLDKILNFVLREWFRDIKNNQLKGILSGVGPMHSFIQIGQGLKDLFAMPIQQYKKDKRIMKGLKRGASSFTSLSAISAIDLSYKIVDFLKAAAETTYMMLSPEGEANGFTFDTNVPIIGVKSILSTGSTSRITTTGSASISISTNVSLMKPSSLSTAKTLMADVRPLDIREGVSTAFNLVKEGFSQTAVDMIKRAATQHEKDGLTGAAGSLLRDLPRGIMRPALATAKATHTLLHGMKHSLAPQARRESLDKWKHHNDYKYSRRFSHLGVHTSPKTEPKREQARGRKKYLTECEGETNWAPSNCDNSEAAPHGNKSSSRNSKKRDSSDLLINYHPSSL